MPPDGGEEVLQLLLPMSLKGEVLTQVHQGHGLQGVERTLELVHQRCYWHGMSEVKQWCKECGRSQFLRIPSQWCITFEPPHCIPSK